MLNLLYYWPEGPLLSQKRFFDSAKTCLLIRNRPKILVDLADTIRRLLKKLVWRPKILVVLADTIRKLLKNAPNGQ